MEETIEEGKKKKIPSGFMDSRRVIELSSLLSKGGFERESPFLSG